MDKTYIKSSQVTKSFKLSGRGGGVKVSAKQQNFAISKFRFRGKAKVYEPKSPCTIDDRHQSVTM